MRDPSEYLWYFALYSCLSLWGGFTTDWVSQAGRFMLSSADFQRRPTDGRRWTWITSSRNEPGRLEEERIALCGPGRGELRTVFTSGDGVTHCVPDRRVQTRFGSLPPLQRLNRSSAWLKGLRGAFTRSKPRKDPGLVLKN